MEFRTGRKAITNYLDDFLFITIAKWICNQMIQQFLDLCNDLNLPVAAEKTEWGSTMIIFLGILLNGEKLILALPLDKHDKALRLLNDLSGKKKVTVKQLQVLTGYLNFLTKAIHVGRAFTRRIYAKYANISTGGKALKPYHHVSVNSEFRFDCEIWRTFLLNFRNEAVCRPMIDIYKSETAHKLKFYSDASAAEQKGMGAVFRNKWLFAQWEVDFIKHKKPRLPTSNWQL